MLQGASVCHCLSALSILSEQGKWHRASAAGAQLNLRLPESPAEIDTSVDFRGAGFVGPSYGRLPAYGSRHHVLCSTLQ